jgi:predicted lysophospholipase L1 biosynthesis ABC-type transport system permease subunit
MKSGFSLGTGGVLARSLRITRATHVLVAAVTATFSANVMITMQFLGTGGRAGLLAIVFSSITVATWAITYDVFTRSAQSAANLRSVGASTGSMSGAVLGILLTYGLAGSVLGAFIGATAGMALGAPLGAGLGFAAEGGAVVAASAGAMAVGVYTGAKAAWRS